MGRVSNCTIMGNASFTQFHVDHMMCWCGGTKNGGTAIAKYIKDGQTCRPFNIIYEAKVKYENETECVIYNRQLYFRRLRVTYQWCLA